MYALCMNVTVTGTVAARPDTFSAAAMENVYYISHNVADFLTYRGFKWVGGKKGKGRGGKKKKK